MKSLLERIDEKLAETSNVDLRAEHLAERACYMARTGDASGAATVVQNVRRDYGDGRSPRVSIRLMLAEGIAAYYGGLGDEADNRILRATELSRALRIRDLNALCAAWLAHLDFFRSNYAKSLSLVDEATSIGDPADSHLQTRIGMVIAHALMHAGRREDAQGWYEFSRGHALAVGDRATIGALMHNRSVLSLAWYRAQQFAGGESATPEVANFLRLEIESSDTYNRATHVDSIMHTSELAVAWARMLIGDFEGAFPILERVHGEIGERERRRTKTSVSADVALCLAKLGQFDQALQVVRQVDCNEVATFDVDDQIVFFGSCLRVCDLANDAALATRFVGPLEKSRQAYLEDLRALGDALAASKACASGPPAAQKNLSH